MSIKKPLTHRGEGLSFAVPPYLIAQTEQSSLFRYEPGIPSDTLDSDNGVLSVNASSSFREGLSACSSRVHSPPGSSTGSNLARLSELRLEDY